MLRSALRALRSAAYHLNGYWKQILQMRSMRGVAGCLLGGDSVWGIQACRYWLKNQAIVVDTYKLEGRTIPRELLPCAFSVRLGGTLAPGRGVMNFKLNEVENRQAIWTEILRSPFGMTQGRASVVQPCTCMRQPEVSSPSQARAASSHVSGWLNQGEALAVLSGAAFAGIGARVTAKVT